MQCTYQLRLQMSPWRMKAKRRLIVHGLHTEASGRGKRGQIRLLIVQQTPAEPHILIASVLLLLQSVFNIALAKP